MCLFLQLIPFLLFFLQKLLQFLSPGSIIARASSNMRSSLKVAWAPRGLSSTSSTTKHLLHSSGVSLAQKSSSPPRTCPLDSCRWPVVIPLASLTTTSTTFCLASGHLVVLASCHQSRVITRWPLVSLVSLTYSTPPSSTTSPPSSATSVSTSPSAPATLINHVAVVINLMQLSVSQANLGIAPPEP